MTQFDPTDPAAEVAYLKALEKAKWPQPATDPGKLKKWHDAEAAPKAKKRPPAPMPTTPRKWRTWTPDADAEAMPYHAQGIPLADVVRVVLIIAAMLAAALGID